MDDTVCMYYMVDRLNRVVTESDLMGVIDELRENIKINEEWRAANPRISPLSFEPDDFDVRAAIDDVKRNYIRRALAQCDSASGAARLLGLGSYQPLQNWMDKLGVEK